MITGVFVSGSSSKRFELFKEVRPQATTFGFLLNAANPANPLFKKDMDNAARTLGIKLEIVEVKDQSELADAFNRMQARGVAGGVVQPDVVFLSKARTIADLARIHKASDRGGNGF